MPNGEPDSGIGTLDPLCRAAPADKITDKQLLHRFHAHRDEAAFEALVQRYGAMVLGVCRRVLDHSQDAEDAFQATFLVLVRKAGTISKPELLGNWLYGVAYRIARKARAMAARRRETERQAVPMSSDDPELDVAWRDMRTVLDKELQGLPEKYRAPLVLCYLQGMTNEEAARRLGWPTGSISYRLARAREMLKARMSRRQQAMPASMFGLVLAQTATSPAAPGALVHGTVHAGMGVAHGQAAGLVSPTVQALVDGTLRSMQAAKIRLVTITVVLAVLGAILGGTLGYAALVPPPAPVHRVCEPKDPAGNQAKTPAAKAR
jgi:RNA polymerase sigma-70 factor (ECF subfamily)